MPFEMLRGNPMHLLSLSLVHFPPFILDRRTNVLAADILSKGGLSG